jgi:outer membrane biosynthesis protein TonB
LSKKDEALKITYLIPKPARVKKTKITKKQDGPQAGAIFKQRALSSEAEPVKVAKLARRKVKIKIPPEVPREKQDSYLTYYQCIREKIKKFIMDNYSDYVACGEVSLYFVLLSNGDLEQLQVLQAKSSHNRALKEIARSSIQQAAPFLPFPEELSQPQLSFNLVVSFELEN